MRKKFAKYIKIMSVSISNSLVYIMDFIGRSVFFFVIMMTFLFLWRTIFSEAGSRIDGFTLESMIWYLLVTETIALSGGRGYYNEISTDVKTGNVAYMLNKPYNYVLYQFSYQFGNVVFNLVKHGLLALIIGFLYVGPLPGFSLIYLPFIALTILFGAVIDFFINFSLALSAFWVEENMPFRWIYQKLVFVLGGMLLPLDMFPEMIKNISLILPFSFVTYAPAKLAIDFSLNNFIYIIAIQGFYLSIAVAVSFMVFAKGVKGVSINVAKSMKRRIDLFKAYLTFNMSASMEYRTSFIIQTFGMFLNNAAFALFWWILYEKVGLINGYSFSKVMTLWAFASTSFGVAMVIFGNLTRMVEVIVKGELDSYLLQPRNVLFNLLMSRSKISGWGDIAYGVILFVLLFGVNLKATLIYVFFTGVGTIVFVSAIVTSASITFFVGSFQSVAMWMMDFMISFSIYPESIYSGFIKVILFTVIPSGLVTMLPTRLIYDFNVTMALLLIGGALIWFGISQLVFNLGLKRYESGNLMVQKL